MFQFVGPGTMSEDCLVLNVWTPTLRSVGNRPVMVWLHGGSFAGMLRQLTVHWKQRMFIERRIQTASRSKALN